VPEAVRGSGKSPGLVDESDTGSVNLWSKAAWGRNPVPSSPGVRLCPMHLRAPSLDHGLVSGLWGIALGLYVLVGALALGLGRAESFILGGIAAALIYFYVRLYGQDEVRARRPRRSAR
jgi:hypothetical protein